MMFDGFSKMVHTNLSKAPLQMNTTDYQPSYGLLNTRKSLASLSVLVGKALFGAGGSILPSFVWRPSLEPSWERVVVGGSR